MDVMHRVKVRGFPVGETGNGGAGEMGRLALEGPEVKHLQVLRLKVGDEVMAFDGLGLEYRARILELSAFGATLELLEKLENDREPPQPITLAIALLKGDKLADVVRAATELGVTSIQLLKTQFADVPDIGANKLERLRRIAEEASKQSRRSVVPQVLGPISLKQIPAVQNSFVAHPGSTHTLLEKLHWNAPVWVVSGPEGGFSEPEIKWLESRGFTAISLGKRILRAETAPLALLGAIAATGI